MMMFIPSTWSTKEMLALADLQHVVASLSTYLGLASVASKLSSFPHGVTGFPIAPSPLSPDAEAVAQEERKDREALNPVLIKAANQRGEVTLVGPSADDAALTADKRAMEQVALAASSPPSLVAEAEAQGKGEKGDTAIGQTLAKLSLHPPRAASAPGTRSVMWKSKQPWVRYGVEIRDPTKKDPIWRATPRAPTSPLSRVRLLSRTERYHCQLPRGLPVPRTEQCRSPTWVPAPRRRPSAGPPLVFLLIQDVKQQADPEAASQQLLTVVQGNHDEF
ncbi:hypothetical protein GUJ93_ZPchr0014g47302 [Zizania palustris]|uniref:Uncharacterized protein n=1 Tax=Zizania palustris TaxID=103762 RepID=A0A8J5TH20_ZIZPA|nr:hypothetical protein GUJ93_ZPchr0014g47302 [Zizania palustris]